MIQIDICVPFYNYNDQCREKLFIKFCNYYKRLARYFKYHNICIITFTFIGSEGETSLNCIKQIFNDTEATYHEFDQTAYLDCTDQQNKGFLNMLTNKFRYAYEMSFSKNPDISLLNGSNDFVSYNYFKQIAEFYKPNEKQLYGVDNYNNGNNFVFYSKNSFFETHNIDLYKNKEKYFLWNGVSNFHGRSIYKYCGGNIGFNKFFYDFNKDFIFEKCISCDEGLIEKSLLTIEGCVKFNSRNVFYLNVKTDSNKELNTYSNLYNLIKNGNTLIEYENLSEQNSILLMETLLYFCDERRIGNIIDNKVFISKKVKIGENNIIKKKTTILSNSKIGSNNFIGENVTIHENVNIGDNNFIGDNTIIYKNTIIGNNNKIFNNNIIGEFPVHTSEEFSDYNLDKCKGVIIGDNNLFHVRNIISTGIENPTKVGNNNKIMSECMISHDIVLHNNVTLYPRVSVGGYCILLDNSNLGMCSVIHQKKVIGQYSMIGANCTITKHVFPYYITINNKIHRINEKKIPNHITMDHDILLRELNDKIKNNNYDNDFNNLNKNARNDIEYFITNIQSLI